MYLSTSTGKRSATFAITTASILFLATAGITVSRLAILADATVKITSFVWIPFSRHAFSILLAISTSLIIIPSLTDPSGVGTRTHPNTVGLFATFSICTICVIFSPTRTTTTFLAMVHSSPRVILCSFHSFQESKNSKNCKALFVN